VSHVAFPIVWEVALLVFAVLIASRARLLLAARPAGRLDRIRERIGRALVYGLGQRKFLSGEQPSGIMHALVFWGFIVLMLQVITLFGRAFDSNWNIPAFGPTQPLGPPFFIARDALEAAVIVGASYMLCRRVVTHTAAWSAEPGLCTLGSGRERQRRVASGDDRLIAKNESRSKSAHHAASSAMNWRACCTA
jgi:hypothetical protein